VYLTHNHHHGRIVDEIVYGRLPVSRLGEEVMLNEEQFSRHYYYERLEFSILTDKWSRKRRTARQVMNKTLQQARRDGIWKPAENFAFLNPFVVYEQKITMPLSPNYTLGFLYDVGVLSVIEASNKEIIGRDVYLTLR